MGEWTAIDDLIRRASDPAASAESLQEAIGPVFATFSPGDRASAEAVLRRLAEEVVRRPDAARPGRDGRGVLRRPRRARDGPDDRDRSDPRPHRT